MNDATGPGELAVRLRRWRTARALSQEELATRAGLTAKAIGALERGERRRPYPHTVRALAEALQLDEDDRALLTAAATAPDAPPAPSSRSRPGRTLSTAGPVTTAAPVTTVAPPLPLPPAPLLGRDADRDRAVELLRSSEVRLLTLIGTGGVGKTRLALEIARALADDFEGGVSIVELETVAEDRLVLPTVARVLGCTQAAGRPVDTLVAALGERRHLLVLDNLEHVLGVADDLAELIARCPGLLVLATSRALLRVRAEHALSVSPLRVPADDDVATVAASPAVQVFLDRAAAAGGAVHLTPATAGAVAAICRRLDGLPLALELAAAHARFLPPPTLLAHLDRALASPRSRDLPERQRTVVAALDWSHGLLTHAEQVLLRRLAVLAGGFSLDAAAAVGGDDVDVLAVLGGLVEQSLLVPLPTPEPRYRALEPVRQYAAARLAEAGEAELVADRAAAFFLRLTAGARAGLHGAEQARWLDLLALEHAHLGAALGRLTDTGRVGEAARMGADTWLYWALRGNTAEALTRLTDVAAAATSGAPTFTDRDRAGLGVALAGLRLAGGDLLGMQAHTAEAIDAARRAGARDLLLEAVVLAGSAAVFLGDLDRAAALMADQDFDGDPWAATHAEIVRAQLLMATGEVTAAVAMMQQAERAARALASPFTLATVLNMRASLALAADEDRAAAACLLEAADLAAEAGTTWTLVYTLPALAVLAARCGQPAAAAELFAAGSATAEVTALAVSFPPDLDIARHWLHAVQTELGPAAFDRAWSAGRRLAPEDVPRVAGRITAFL